MNANGLALVPCRERGWKMGLVNMLAKENHGWWRTRRWWILVLLWLIILNVGSGTDLRMGMPDNFLFTAGLVLPIAAIVLSQDAILGERHSGTAAWVFSKPLRRPAFLLAKIIAYGLGFLVTGVLLPGGIACLQIIASGSSRSFLPGFAASLGLVYLNLLFYLTLALMLATLFQGRGPVLGITLFLVWAWMLAPSVWLADFMPWRLLIALGEHGALPPLGRYLVQGLPLPTVTPIIATVLWCALFVTVTIWRFRREEF
jgi:ABC-type transport system involved in multi-copper enzyme maturation permease subunit